MTRQTLLYEGVTEALYILGSTLKDSLGKTEEGNKLLARLVTDYIAEDRFVTQAKEELGTQPLPTPRNKLILLDASQRQSYCIMNRGLGDHSGREQWAAAHALIDAGFTVHSNDIVQDKDCLTPAVMSRYGLIIMNVRYSRNNAFPPMAQPVIDNLVSYVNNGGALLVLAEANSPGEKSDPEFYNGLLNRFGIMSPLNPNTQCRERAQFPTRT